MARVSTATLKVSPIKMACCRCAILSCFLPSYFPSIARPAKHSVGVAFVAFFYGGNDAVAMQAFGVDVGDKLAYFIIVGNVVHIVVANGYNIMTARQGRIPTGHR